jgi:hypothetical protein
MIGMFRVDGDCREWSKSGGNDGEFHGVIVGIIDMVA